MWSETEVGGDGERRAPPWLGTIGRGPSPAVEFSWGATSGDRSEQGERPAAVRTTEYRPGLGGLN